MSKIDLAWKEDQGFTIVEMLVALTIAGIITTLAWRGYIDMQLVFSNWQRKSDLEESAMVLLSGMSRKLRHAQKITKAEVHELAFIDKENIPRHFYTQQAGIFQNQVVLLATNEFQPTLRFAYFSNNDDIAQEAPVNQITKVRIELTLMNNKNESFMLRTSVFLRNLGKM